MFIKNIKLFLIVFLFYQTPLYSKSTSFDNFKSKNLSKYFSGIVAFENKDSSTSLKFFNSSKILIDKHDAFLKRYIYSLVLEGKVSRAINITKNNKDKDNTNFFDAHLLLILDSLKRGDFNKANIYLEETSNFSEQDRFHSAILESLKHYIYVFKEKKILNQKKNFGNLSIISETFQRCFLDDKATDTYFSNLFNNLETDYSRYIYFYLSYLIEKNRLEDAKKIIDEIDYLNSKLLISQGKSWIENGDAQKLISVFSCKNPNDIVGEFLFLISNLYSSQDNFQKSNFYLNLSNFLNPKFVFNLSLVVENQYLNEEYKKAKKTLKNFKKEDSFYYWYRIKKESQIIAKLRNKNESLNYMITEFKKNSEPNNKILFDVANFYKNSKKYNEAIKYYSMIINNLNENSDMKADLLYRRGSSFERIKEYKKADKDFLEALKFNPDDAYVLNYLAYSWLERNHKINEAIEMLEKAYSFKKNDPYIIDSIGWAYYLINNYIEAEKFLRRAVELMPNDPIVNDHYGDILWKLDRKIQARYFWSNVLEMEDAENEMIENINAKMIFGLKKS
tara:strand:+ start:1787 stop:3472 length:1686 start_codon:yes stop_codon:yes gene_type:complete